MLKEFFKNKNFYLIYVLFSISLIFEFFFNLDLLGGTKEDFYTTFIIVENIKRSFSLFKEGIFHFPTHYIILSLIDSIFNNKTYTRFIYLLLSLTIPLIFYKCLKLKEKKINKTSLLLISCSLFLLPAFRTSAIWANVHITAVFFFTISIYFFLIFEKNNYKKKKIFFY